MVIFHSYVNLPEGITYIHNPFVDGISHEKKGTYSPGLLPHMEKNRLKVVEMI